MGKALIAAVLLALTGCAHPIPAEDPRAIWCEHESPRRHTEPALAAMSRAEIDKVNAHNWRGVEWCGWKP